MTLFYCPLEPLVERYTGQLAAPGVGWLERNWMRAGVDYVRIEGNKRAAGHIKTGQVLDAVGRSTFCFHQVYDLLQKAEQGQLQSKDVIYFDDFWHPGVEALPYAFHLLGIRPRMYATLYAQSVDVFDFTYPMRGWMRHFEKGIGAVLDGVFVACPTLKGLVVDGGIAPVSKVHSTGLIFCSEEVLSTAQPYDCERKNKVVFSSRWDAEKNPLLFLEIAELVLQRKTNTEFVVCSSAPRLRSNDKMLLEALDEACRSYPGRVIKKEGLEKWEYYRELAEAKIQLNTAHQDFVSFTLLESSVFGCYPIYPWFRSFPETFRGCDEYMYSPSLSAKAAAEKVCEVLERVDLWTDKAKENRSWIHRRFDSTWARQLEIMEIEGDYERGTEDPFN